MRQILSAFINPNFYRSRSRHDSSIESTKFYFTSREHLVSISSKERQRSNYIPSSTLQEHSQQIRQSSARIPITAYGYYSRTTRLTNRITLWQLSSVSFLPQCTQSDWAGRCVSVQSTVRLYHRNSCITTTRWPIFRFGILFLDATICARKGGIHHCVQTTEECTTRLVVLYNENVGSWDPTDDT